MMRRTPFGEIEQMFDQMRHSLWSSTWADTTDTNLRLESTADGYVVLADLPGFQTEDIDLRFEDGTLTIDATHERENEYSTGRRHLYERVVLPADAEILVDDIDASYSNGVLEVVIPSVEPVAIEDDASVDIEIGD